MFDLIVCEIEKWDKKEYINELNIKTMDLNYLQNEILPKREQEIKDGKNLATRQPIYVVLDSQENFCSGHSDYEPSTNYRGREGGENAFAIFKMPELNIVNTEYKGVS